MKFRITVVATVDAGGLLELGGDLGEERAQQVDGQGQLGDHVDQGEAGSSMICGGNMIDRKISRKSGSRSGNW
jgi:hypothetical protein